MSGVIAICTAALTVALYARSIWSLSKTARQRRRLIEACADAMRGSNYETDYWPAFGSVSFDRHWWLLLTFRDPIREYVGLPHVAFA